MPTFWLSLSLSLTLSLCIHLPPPLLVIFLYHSHPLSLTLSLTDSLYHSNILPLPLPPSLSLSLSLSLSHGLGIGPRALSSKCPLAGTFWVLFEPPIFFSGSSEGLSGFSQVLVLYSQNLCLVRVLHSNLFSGSWHTSSIVLSTLSHL